MYFREYMLWALQLVVAVVVTNGTFVVRAWIVGVGITWGGELQNKDFQAMFMV